MPTLETVCAHGFLPKELPPQFSSVSLGRFLATDAVSLPAQIQRSTRIADTGVHSLARFGVQRRQLGIPNPIAFSKLASCLVANWPILTAAFSPSSFSETKPADRPAPDRPFDRSDSFASRPFVRARVRSTARYLVTADVSRFYHSLYTHSIPWALHTKPVAKANKSQVLLGNQIDRLVRDGQDGQSVGIPVGPDTSLVLAEVVLGQVDQLLVSRGVTNGFRIIDDYEIGTRTLGEAEQTIAVLQASLSEYELDLNGAKTAIQELPMPHESPWTSRITAFSLPAGANSQSRGLLEFFDRVFEQARLFPEDPVVSFSIRRAARFALDPGARQSYEQLLLQCLSVEPASLRYVIPELVRLSATGFALDAGRLEEVLNGAVTRHAPLGHGSEVAWAITGLMHANQPLTADAVGAASRMMDSVVALCLLDASSRGLVPSVPSFTSFASCMTTDDLFGKQWLLAYEANVKGWLPSVGPGDHVRADRAFSALKAAGVSFYDPTALPMPLPAPPYEGGYGPYEYGT
jgi:hypothetical protein